MKYTNLEDSQLAELLRQNDARAFQEIYFRHWRKLLLVAREKVPSGENAEDLIQDLFVRLWEQRHELAISNLSAYLFTSLRNTIINKYRSRLIHEKFATHYQTVVSWAQNTEEEIALNDLMTSLEREMEELPYKTREIFRLSRIEHKSVREISQELQIPERTIEHHLTQAVRKLRHLLKDYLWLFLIPFLPQ